MLFSLCKGRLRARLLKQGRKPHPMVANRIARGRRPIFGGASGSAIILSLLVTMCSSPLRAQGVPKPNGADSAQRKTRAPACDDYLNGEFSLAQLEAACESSISDFERQRQALLRDRLQNADRIAGIDAIICHFEIKRRKLLISLGRFAGGDACPGHPGWFRNGGRGSSRRSSGGIAPALDNPSSNWAGSISELPMSGSLAPYIAVTELACGLSRST